MTELGEEIFEELINITEQLKKLSTKEKELKELISENYQGEVTFGEYKISKVLTNKVVLKDGITITDVKARFGDEYITYDVDIKELKKNPEAHDILTLKSSSYIKILESKKKEEI